MTKRYAEGVVLAALAEAVRIGRNQATALPMDIASECIAVMDADQAPIPMRLTCPECKALHIDEGEFATKVHHTHSCQNCGLTWRPAVVPTVGVRFLPGFKNEP